MMAPSGARPSGGLGDRRGRFVDGELQFNPARLAVDDIGQVLGSDWLIAEGAVDRDHRGLPFQLLDAGRFALCRDT
jgi:hypothetical protein